MMRLILLFWIFISSALNAQLVSYNKTESLDLGELNLEWFGDSLNGPADNALQLKNATQLIQTMDLDLLSLCEISDSIYWKRLLNAIPNYNGVISAFSQTQKTALLFKKDKFKILYTKQILSQYSSDFASGRLPLEVALETTFENKKDTLIVLVIHLKSNVGTAMQKADSYNKRFNSSKYLKNYVDQISTKKVIVTGDWNDDFDSSIYNSNVSPFLNWTIDTNYVVITKILSNKHIGTTASYPDAIDHILANSKLKKLWQKDSVFVVNPSNEIKGYSLNTSDHFPVVSRFFWKNSTNKTRDFEDCSRYNLYWNGNEWVGDCINHKSQVKVYNEIGLIVFEGYLNDFIPPKSKVFVIRIQKDNKIVSKKLILLD